MYDGTASLFHNRGIRLRWTINTTPRPLSSWQLSLILGGSQGQTDCGEQKNASEYSKSQFSQNTSTLLSIINVATCFES
jgi:hypothetical protein